MSLSKLFSVLKNITAHELNKNNKLKAIARFAKWQLSNKINSHPIVYPFLGDTKLIIHKGMTGATGNLYCGLHEFSEMSFLLHLLRAEDLFLDIGANVGSYTVLSSGYIKAKTISLEPVPSTFNHLQNNIAINHIGNKVTALNIALGSDEGVINFTASLDTVNHVAVPEDKNIIEVPVNKLDNILSEQIPLLIKIDVEGFETEVLNGGKKTLHDKKLKAIIIELTGHGNRYNYDEGKIHEMLNTCGFKAFLYDAKKRTLSETHTFG